MQYDTGHSPTVIRTTLSSMQRPTEEIGGALSQVPDSLVATASIAMPECRVRGGVQKGVVCNRHQLGASQAFVGGEPRPDGEGSSWSCSQIESADSSTRSWTSRRGRIW